ncbi:MAG TPA: ubiquinol-cytochrome c reductase iron-sulfur subunit [Pirellulales bacterium]|jgi:Rieske Fe-S protein|nr:ubiquinol-cytochrome c reductase iron-sulfur subunit [Pirellulales bacterium]
MDKSRDESPATPDSGPAAAGFAENAHGGAAPRRSFLQWFAVGLGAVAAVAVSLPLVGYFFRVPKRRTMWVPLGPAEQFPLAETRVATFDNPLRTPWDGSSATTSIFVRREQDNAAGEQFLVLLANCAHLGCPVSWFPQSGLFMCPCHGGVYYATGERASGPPPRGLFPCNWRVRAGQLEIEAPHFPSLRDCESLPG